MAAFRLTSTAKMCSATCFDRETLHAHADIKNSAPVAADPIYLKVNRHKPFCRVCCAPEGSAARTVMSGCSALAAVAMPDISPPPETHTMMASNPSGTCCSSSSATVPCQPQCESQGALGIQCIASSVWEAAAEAPALWYAASRSNQFHIPSRWLGRFQKHMSCVASRLTACRSSMHWASASQQEQSAQSKCKHAGRDQNLNIAVIQVCAANAILIYKPCFC